MRTKKEILKTKRIILKSINDSDRDSFIAICKDPKVYATYMLPDLLNKEQEDKFFNRLKELCQDKSRFIYGIYLENEIIGFLNEVEKSEDGIEIGYFISSKHWNKGYATEAFKVAIKELFDMGYKYVYAGHFENNLASGKVMQKCGMHLIDKNDFIEYRNINYRVIYYQIGNKNI